MHKQTRMMEPMEGEFLVMDNYRNVTVDVAEDCAFMCYNGGQEECTGFELDEPTLLCQYYRRRLDTTDLMPLLGKQFPASIVLVPIVFYFLSSSTDCLAMASSGELRSEV